MKKSALKALFVLLLGIMPFVGYADVPGTMSYQGYLSDAQDKPVDGTVDITFSIPSTTWTETHTGVQVKQGVFGVLLGSQNPLTDVDFSQPHSLRIEVNGVSQTVPLSSVPYALHAKTVEQGIFGQFKPHDKQIKWAITARTTYQDVDLGLDSTSAKYILAMVYATASENDHVNHLFGKAFPGCSTWSHRKPTGYYNCDSEPSSDSYVVMNHNGQNAGEDRYGIHQFLIIPLKNNHRLDAVLGDGYSMGTHYIKMRMIGYVE
jgi:hypothetical protein